MEGFNNKQMKNKKKLKELLETLRNSCEEGLDGTWDCSTAEGREAFTYMADNCVDIALLLGIKLKPYKTKTNG